MYNNKYNKKGKIQKILNKTLINKNNFKNKRKKNNYSKIDLIFNKKLKNKT